MIPIGARTATIVDDVAPCLDPDTLAFARYPHLDRGRYAVADVPDLAPLAPLLAHARAAAPDRTALTITGACVVVLTAGDYVLAHHDVFADDRDDDLPLELVHDLSPAPTPDADLYYRRRGAVYFALPSRPRALAIVERGPSVTSNHTYVSVRHASARVVRLIARAR